LARSRTRLAQEPDAASGRVDCACVECDGDCRAPFDTVEYGFVPTKDSAKREYLNSSLEKSLHVLEFFDVENRSLSLSEIARRIGSTPGGATPILSTLERHGFVARDPETKRYRLGLTILERASCVLASLDASETAKPALRSLANELRVNAHLAVRYDAEVLYVHREEAAPAVVFQSIIGRRVPLYCTALGKVFLAFGPSPLLEEVLGAQLAAVTPKTLTTPRALRDDIGATRVRGFSIDDEEFHLGQVCVGVPIRDFQSRVVAAMSISIAKPRLEAEPLSMFSAELVKAGLSVSTALGNVTCKGG
jgi:IclR family KDG regulon transcriptional repressor